MILSDLPSPARSHGTILSCGSCFGGRKQGRQDHASSIEYHSPMRPFRPEATCPLDGIRVLDLSRLVAGNMLSLQLADFGAEVIKIEDPRKGHPLRVSR